MVCASCGRATKSGARFCGGCGASLAPRCPACGAECEPDLRFCEACGGSLAAPAAPAAVARKVVTIVFADLIGSTALHERLDPESVSRIMEGYHRSVRAPIEAHGGTVVQLLGDGVMCAFGVPRVAEDDALRAVRAGVAVQRSFREFLGEHAELADRVGLRVAVNTGEVVISDDYAAGIGDPLNVAARLQQEAKDGDVLIGESTQRLVGEQVTLARVGSFALKGRAEPVTAYRVVSLERPARAAAAAFVGRDDELRRITAVYDTALAAPAARLAVLLGSPGLGKSRLLAEFERRLGDGATVLTAQCDAAGSATFVPLAEALRVHLELEATVADDALRAAIDAVVTGEADERDRIARGIGALLAGTPASPEETFFVVRRLLAALATKRPVVLVIDDLQWAEPLLLDFTEHLVQWGAGVPLLVLAAARPELRDARSSLTTPGGVVSDVVTLTGLDAGAAMRLAANVIGADTLPAAVAGRVLTTSEGNPLFLGELVRMLVNDGALQKVGERWTLAVDLAALEMPPTIQALLAARIERLRPEERLVLERAAVVGRQFSRAAVTHLLPSEAHADLDARLEALRRSELIEPDTGWLLGEPALRFHHLLIRDAAYRRILRGTRAELHGRFADWLEARAGESVEYDETIGWHLEQAHHHLRELGPLDANARALGERASRHLAAAGRRALARDDLQPAASLLGRALACVGDTDPARAELALDWCEALLAAGEVGPAAAAIEELGRFTSSSDRLRAWHTCFIGELAALTDPQALRATADAVAAAAAALAAAGDAAGEAKAHSVHAVALSRLGKIGACETALDRALAAARRTDDRRRANSVLAGAPVAALWGPGPVTRASGRCLDVVRVLRITQGAPAVEAVALRCQGVLEALRGRTEAARRMIASSRHMVEELGITQGLLETEMFAGLVDLIEGDDAAAERSLRTAYEGFRDHGLGIDAARAAALLGRTLLPQGRAAEAEALSHESEALAGDDLQAAITWRRVRAEALALRGEHAAAVDFARAAVEIAAATDALLHHADARLALAAALRAAGRGDEADAEERRAIELWEAKGATLLAERSRREAGRAEPAALAPAESSEAVRTPSRRVRANAATAYAARVDSAFAARDVDAVGWLLSDDYAMLDHPSGVTYDREAELFSHRALLRAQHPTHRHEPLATLGDSLGLCRLSVSARGYARGDLDVGAYERERIELIEVDARGCARRIESFAADHLGDAVARLYERYAELLPDGPERIRAAATARSVAAVVGPVDVDRYATAFAPAIESVDHRILGTFSARGADAVLGQFRSWLDLADVTTFRLDEILGLESAALLVRRIFSGTDRAGGGAFERSLIQLWSLGPDGLATRLEIFDLDREAEALARFDELAAEPPRPIRRRVRANAATVYAGRHDSAFAARDADVRGLLSDDFEMLDHPTGVTYDREAELVSFGTLLRVRDPRHRHEPLATLGDSLALCRVSVSASGYARGDLDVGAFERPRVDLIEVDAQGRARRTESFADDHLGDAVARLYERYAELLPDGPERTRAVGATRVVKGMLEPPDPDRWASALAPAIEFVDRRRIFGMGSVHGADALLENVRPLQELSDEYTHRIEDILAAQPDAMLMHGTNVGTDRASGGAYERRCLLLSLVGADGRVTRIEVFDPDRDAEALARFDELTAEAPAARLAQRRVQPNAATRNEARISAAIAARDLDAIADLYADPAETVHHPTGVTYGRDGILNGLRKGLENAEGWAYRVEPVASLGESLALARVRISAAGANAYGLDIGAADWDHHSLIEVDAQERRRWTEVFAVEKLGDAIARLYERHAEVLPDGPARARAAATARTVAALVSLEPFLSADRYNATNAPDVEFTDHRALVGLPPARGADEIRRRSQRWFETVEDSHHWVDDVFDLRSDGLLVRQCERGRDRAGGDFENRRLALWLFDAEGLVARIELFDGDRVADALARFDELTAEPPAPRFANAAWRFVERSRRLRRARDWSAFRACLTPSCVMDDRRPHVQLRLSLDQVLASERILAESPGIELQPALLATRGDRLALLRVDAVGHAADGGPVELDHLCVLEVDADARAVALVVFELDALEAAYAELDARYGAPEHTAFFRDIYARDWDAVAARFAPDLVVEDPRRLGWETLHGSVAYLEAIQDLVELAPDVRVRVDHAAESDRGALVIATTLGTRDGGAFEIPRIVVLERDAQRRTLRIDMYDLDQLDAARARFEELRPDPLRIPPNAATRARDRSFEAWRARDWDACRALASPDFRFEDRGKRALLGGDVETWIANNRFTEPGTVEREWIGTAGDRIALERVLWTDEGVEREHLRLTEVDADGRMRASIRFDPDDRGAAFEEAHVRFAAGEAAASGGQAPIVAFMRAYTKHDWKTARGLLADAFVLRDHRTLGLGALGPDEWIESLRVIADLAPGWSAETLRILAWNRHGRVDVSRHFGAMRDGGPFENIFVRVAVTDGDRLQHNDTFDVGDADRAVARFEELCAERDDRS